MSTAGIVLVTIALALGAAVTAGLWLNLLLWVPLSALNAFVPNPMRQLPYVAALMLAGAFGTVFVVGVFFFGLPWYAAAVAGTVVAATSYPRPNLDGGAWS